MVDLYQGSGGDLGSPARMLRAVTPSDIEPLPIASTAPYVGVAGDVSIIAVNDSEPVLVYFPAGTWLPVRAAFVMSTGTTATEIIAAIG
ncbi:hypothetical protein ACOSOMT5_P0689 [Acidiphilium sp. MT5]